MKTRIKQSSLVILILFCSINLLLSQNEFDIPLDMNNNKITDASQISIGTETPDPLAAFEINSTSQGFLLPRMTIIERNTMAGMKPEGLQVFNTTTKCVDTWSGFEWLSKCSSHGPVGGIDASLLDVNAVGGPACGFANEIDVDASGNYYITGQYSDSLDLDNDGLADIISASGTDFFIAKFLSNGNLNWVTGSSGSSSRYGRSVKVDSNGDVIIIGDFYGSMDLDNDMINDITAVGSQDVFIVKYDGSNGAFEWVQQIGGTSSEYGKDIDLDSNDDLIVVGQYYGDCDFNGDGINEKTAVGSIDIFIAKYGGLNGSFILVQNIGSTASVVGNGIFIDNNNRKYITGSLSGSTDFDEDGNEDATTSGASDIFVARYHANGSLSWVETFGGFNTDNGYDISGDNSGNIYVTGSFEANAEFGPYKGYNAQPNTYDKFFLMELGEFFGFVKWVAPFMGTSYDYGRGVVSDGTKVYAVGEVKSTVLSLPDFSINTTGCSDLLIVIK